MPICLVGCLHKILGKLLALRLKKVIGGLILNCQLSFVPDRQLLDGVLIASEIVDLSTRDNVECVLFKVDFEKANDCVKTLRIVTNNYLVKIIHI